jgi:hypothetical protein
MPTRVIAGSRTAHGACPSCRLIAPVSPQYPGSGSRASHDRQPEHPERCLTGDGRRTARACAERQAATGRGAAGSSATRQSREPPCGRGHTLRPCSSGRPQAAREIVAEHRHPGIDDLQSSSSAGPRGGGVECNSTIPGVALRARSHPGFAYPAGRKRSRRPLRNTDSPRDRRLAVVVFRRSEGRQGRVQLDHPGNRPAGSATPPVLFIRTASSNRQPIEELRIEPETS